MSPLNLLAATCTRMYQRQPYPTHPSPPQSINSCSNDSLLTHHNPQQTHISPLEYSPTYLEYPPSYGWYQHSPNTPDPVPTGYQQTQQQFQWQQTVYTPTTGPTFPKQRRCAKCQCPNCINEDFSVVNKKQSKRQHVCHVPGCGKVYGKTSHLQAHLR